MIKVSAEKRWKDKIKTITVGYLRTTDGSVIGIIKKIMSEDKTEPVFELHIIPIDFRTRMATIEASIFISEVICKKEGIDVSFFKLEDI